MRNLAQRHEAAAGAEADVAPGDARRALHRMCGVSIIAGELDR